MIVHLWRTCVKGIFSRGIFFIFFFKTLIFWVVREVKEPEMAQNYKNCLSCSISQEPYII